MVGAVLFEKNQKSDKRRRKISVVKLLTASTEIAIKERRQRFLWFLVLVLRRWVKLIL